MTRRQCHPSSPSGHIYKNLMSHLIPHRNHSKNEGTVENGKLNIWGKFTLTGTKMFFFEQQVSHFWRMMMVDCSWWWNPLQWVLDKTAWAPPSPWKPLQCGISKCMIRYNMVWYGLVWLGMVWCSVVKCGRDCGYSHPTPASKTYVTWLE